MAACLIALGSNLGDSAAILERAISELRATPAVFVRKRSRWFRTSPIGGPAGQEDFVNAAVRIETSLDAQQVHAVLREVETRLGRQRRRRWGARRVDLDLLLYADLVWQTSRLTIPHPRMAFRRFVLEPAAEVAADMRHPLIGWTVGELLAHLNSAVPYVALTGDAGSGKTALARQIAAAASLRLIEDPATARCDRSDRSEQHEPPEIQLLRRRAQRLNRDAWPRDSGAISDFWIGQSLVETRLRGAEVAAADRLWQCEASQSMPPKLLAWLAPPRIEAARASGRRRDAKEAAKATEAGVSERAAMWAEVVARYYRGPLLRLDSARPDWALLELTAAIEAMK